MDRVYTKICKIDSAKRLIYGPALVPETFDSQEHIASAVEIEKAAHDFLAGVNEDRQMGVMHEDFEPEIAVVESYIAPVDFDLGDDPISIGTWVIVSKVYDDDVWQRVQDGELTGYSIAGKAVSEIVDDLGNTLENGDD
jgi:DNA adenine methylase